MNFPDILVSDLLPDLLLHLPLKSLIQFSFVSKQWNSLITNPRFRRSIISNQKPIAVGLLIESDRDYDLPSIIEYFPFDQNRSIIPPLLNLDGVGEKVSPIQTCNGLLLCYRFLYHQGGVELFYVCNPTTNKSLLLPQPDGKSKVWLQVIGMTLAFDPAKSPYYDVVAVLRLMDFSNHIFQIYIYSSELGVWRVSKEPPFDKQDPIYKTTNFGKGVYWNGGVHWVTMSHLVNPNARSYCFDIGNEMLKSMPNLPITKTTKSIKTTRTDYYFGESCGHLIYVESGFVQLDFYELRKDYSEWYIKHNVNLLQITMGDYNHQKVSVAYIVCGEKKDSYLILRVPGQIIQYDLVSNTFHKLRDIDDRLHFRVFQYIESICHV